MPHPPPRPAAFHDMYYARAFPAYGHHLPHHSYPESNGRSTPDSDYSYDSKSRMRWILSLGLLLPALAAIIGVVAWAVSAEVVMGAHRESAMKASEAFRLSQGPRDLEWRAVQEDEINHISNPIMNLEPPQVSPVRESGSSVGKESLDNNNNYDDSGEEEDESEETTTIPTSTTTSSSTTASPVTITSPTRRSLTSTTTRRITSSTTTRSTTPAATTTAPVRIIEAKSKQSGKEDSRAKLSSKDLPVNASTIFFLNGADSASDGPGKSGSKKKSPGDQVADVINRLVAQRQTSGVTRHPHIVVVAPLHDSRKNNKSSISSSNSNRSFLSSPTLSPRGGGGGQSMQSWTPRTTKKPTKTTSSQSQGKGKVRITNDDMMETTTKAAILSKDADTLLAAAQMLAARHKMISMRKDDDDDEDDAEEEDEEEDEPRWQANKVSGGRTSSSSSSSSSASSSASSPSLTASASSSSSLAEASTTASTTVQPIRRFQPISVPLNPYPHPLPPPPPPHHPPQQMHYPHHSLHPLAPVHPHVRHGNQLQHGSPQPPPPPPPPAFPSHPPPHHRLPQQHSSDRMGHVPLLTMASHYAPTHSVHPAGRSLPPPPLSQQPHRPPPPPPSFGSPHIPHQMMPHASNPHIRFMPHNLRMGPYPPPPVIGPNQQQFIRGPQGQLLPVQLNGPFPMDGPQPPAPEASEETVTETVDESQVATTYEGSDSNPNKAVVQFHAEDPQAAASGANKGLTLHFGGGPVGGGGQLVTNPVGIFKTLLLPLLPKHHANFNGKLVFGFVLEKGVQKKKPVHPIVKFLPSHMYRH